ILVREVDAAFPVARREIFPASLHGLPRNPLQGCPAHDLPRIGLGFRIPAVRPLMIVASTWRGPSSSTRPTAAAAARRVCSVVAWYSTPAPTSCPSANADRLSWELSPP